MVTAVWVTDYAYQALRGRVRARLAARRNQLRAGIRLSKFLLRHGRRRPEQIGAWTLEHLEWVRSKVRFEEGAKNATLLDYLHEVEHMATRFTRLEQAIDAALPVLPQTMRMVIDAL